MRVLVVGDIYSIHTYNFIHETLLQLDIDEIVVWGTGFRIEFKEEYDLFYKKNNIRIVQRELDDPNKFDNLMKGYEKVKEYGMFDVCHLHYLGYPVVTVGLLIKNICKKVISNYWGSDWLRANDTRKQYQKYILELSDYIVADSLQICEQLNEYWNNNLQEKIQYIRFKTPVINIMQSGEIDKGTKKTFMEKYHIPSGKRVVTCGYSASNEHNHGGIVNAIKELSKGIKENLFIIVPMTYDGKYKEYVDEIKQAIKESAAQGVVITNYLDFKEVVLLRLVTDIFINVEPTDAYSSTMIEYAYCNKITIIGKWLDYSQLEKQGAYFEKIDGIEELTGTLANVLNNFEEVQKLFSRNKAASEKFQEDSAGNERWRKLYYEGSMCSKQNMLFDNMGERIESWIRKNNYQNVGIYGAGILGGLAYQKLADVIGDKQICLFDKNVNQINWYPGTILKPELLGEKELSVVIMTPGGCMDELKATYGNKVSSEIITYVEWLAELENM